MEAFVFCCGVAYELRPGEKEICPVCGRELRIPKRPRETLGTLERDEEHFLNDTHPLP